MPQSTPLISGRTPVQVFASGFTDVITATPTVSATPDYTVGDVIGGLMTVSDSLRDVSAAQSGIIHLVGMASQVDHSIDVDIIIFASNPTNSTFTDNSALAVDVDDAAKIVGVAQLTTRVDLGTPIWSQATNLAIPIRVSSGKDFYAVAVDRTGGLNLAATDDITFVFGILQD